MEFGKKKSLALIGRLRQAGQKTHRCPVRARLHPRFPEAQLKSEGARTRSTSRCPRAARALGLILRVPPRARPHAGRGQHKPRPYLSAWAGLRAPREEHGRSGAGSLRLRSTRPASPGAPALYLAFHLRQLLRGGRHYLWRPPRVCGCGGVLKGRGSPGRVRSRGNHSGHRRQSTRTPKDRERASWRFPVWRGQRSAPQTATSART